MKALLLLCACVMAGPTFAEQTTGEKIQKAGRDVKSSAKKAYHHTKEKACEMVNGKMH